MVDISHESLIRQWNNLRTWVDQEATDADIYRRLAETASRHSEAEPRFYRDAELQEAIAWQRLQRPGPSAIGQDAIGLVLGRPWRSCAKAVRSASGSTVSAGKHASNASGCCRKNPSRTGRHVAPPVTGAWAWVPWLF